jgi:Xaa-Pro aminopeptidase
VPSRSAFAKSPRTLPGGLELVSIDSARQVVIRGLVKLKLIQSATATFDGYDWMRCSADGCPQRQLYAWRGYGGHGIGLEGAELAHYDLDGTFAVGDVITVEPGLYFSTEFMAGLPNTPRNRAMKAAIGPVFARYQGIGIKIEDDYALTESGVEWLTKGLPREAEEVERMMRQKGEASCSRSPGLMSQP